MSTDRFNVLLADVKRYADTFQREVISFASVVTIIRHAMAVVETHPDFATATGLECKECVIAVVTQVVNDLLEVPQIAAKLTPDGVAAIQLAVTMAPSFIDAAVNFAKVKINAANSASAPENADGAGVDTGVAKRGCCWR